MKKTILIILGFFLFAAASFAQIDNPVKWKFATEKLSDDELQLTIVATIEDGWHLYGQFFPDGGPVKLSITFEESADYQLVGKAVESPKPHVEHDDIFMIDVQYFEKKATFTQKIKILSTKKFKLVGEVSGQACYDDKCVLVGDEFELKIKGVKKKENADKNSEKVDKQNSSDTSESADNQEDTSETTLVIETDTLARLHASETAKISGERTETTPIIATNNPWTDENTEDGSFIWFFLVAMFFGFTALVTPCVFPMIPMTVSFFMHSEQDRAKSRMKALIYGISIVVIYTLPIAIIIAIANVFGNTSLSGDFANFLSTHWIPNIFFFLVFMVFAASFLGMFEIVLPSWLVNKSDKQVDKGGLLGTFFMAFTLVLVSFSCTGPIVGGILVESTQGGQILKPIFGMLGFSIGVAAPFTLFAFFPSLLKNLPKSGGWLNAVKVTLGFVELALGLKFLSVADQTYHWGLLDREIYIAFWIVIFLLLGVYYLGKLKFAHDSDSKFISVPRLGLAVITFTFVMYLIPGMFGAPLKALSGYLPPQATHDFDLVKLIRGETATNICSKPKYDDQLHLPHGLHGYFDYYEALACSKEQNKPIFIDFTGHGCVNCREMEANVWSDPKVLKILQEDFVILAMYVDDKKIKLPENEWFTSSLDGKKKKTLGKQNADIQMVNFNVNSQPYYVLLDYDGNVLAQPHQYNLNVDEFVNFLQKGKAEFAKQRR